MTGNLIEVREAQETDAAALKTLRALSAPRRPARSDLEAAGNQGAFGRGCLLCSVEGQVVGCCLWRYPSAEPRAWCAVRVFVDPRWRCQGYGELLWLAMQPYLERLAAERLSAQVLADDLPIREWVKKLGFCEVGERVELVLDLNEAALANAIGVRQVSQSALSTRVGNVDLLSTDEVGERELEAYFQLYCACLAEAPEALREPAPDRGYFEAVYLNDAIHPKGQSLLAWLDGQVIGYTALMNYLPSAYYITITGVHPSLRRHGVGSFLKASSVINAFSSGAEQVATSNLTAKPGIIEINRRLGFMRTEGTVILHLRTKTASRKRRFGAAHG